MVPELREFTYSIKQFLRTVSSLPFISNGPKMVFILTTLYYDAGQEQNGCQEKTGKRFKKAATGLIL